MCEACEINLALERQRLTKLAIKNPMPCLLCGDEKIIGAGTWIPDESKRLAAGATAEIDKVFAFCLCRIHADPTEENERLIAQHILRNVRTGEQYEM